MFVCKTMRLCSYLLSKGFEIKKEEIDKFNPNFKVWCFENTPQIWAEVTKYKNREKDF